MPKYITDLLHKLCYKPSQYPQYSPFHFMPIIYGHKGQQQMAQLQEEPTTSLPKHKIKYIESIVGSLLYYARVIDSTMLPVLNNIAKSQAYPAQLTLKQCQQILDYANTYRHVVVRYYANTNSYGRPSVIRQWSKHKRHKSKTSTTKFQTNIT